MKSFIKNAIQSSLHEIKSISQYNCKRIRKLIKYTYRLPLAMLTGADPVVVGPCHTRISLGLTEASYASENLL